VKEALDRAAQSLRSQGHDLVTLSPEDFPVAEISRIGSGLLSLDDTAGELIASGGEPIVPSVSNLINQGNDIDWKTPLDLGSDRFENLAILQNKRAEMAEVWRKVWTLHKLDAVICPPAQSTAVQHDQFGLPIYSLFLNVLDVSLSRLDHEYVCSKQQQYPACIIPCGTANTKGTSFVSQPGQGTPVCKCFENFCWHCG
jgi:amidase